VLGWLASIVPGLQAAAVLDADGAVVAGDAALAGARDGGHDHRGAEVVVARGSAASVAVAVRGPVLGGLLREDLATAVALLEPGAASG